MQVDDVRKQDRHQDVAVQELQYEIGNDQPDKDRFETPLKISHQRDGQRHHGGADVGNQYGQTHGDGQQGSVIQSERLEDYVRDHPHDGYLVDLAAYVITDLCVHFLPQVTDQGAVARQKPAHPVQNSVLVLHQEKDHQGHQDQVNQDRDNGRDGSH